MGHRAGSSPLLSGNPVDIDSPIRICAFGDSIAANNTFTNAGSNSRRVYGDINILQFLSSERFLWSAADNLGVGGNTTTQMAARLANITDRQAAGASICFFMGGTNDIIAKTATGTITGNYTTILDHITVTLGMTAIVRPVLSRSDWSTLTAPEIVTAKAAIQTCNAFLKAYCETNPRAFYQNGLYEAWDDGTTAPKADYTYDGVHPDSPGALVMARYNMQSLVDVYGLGRVWPPTHTNLLANATLTGSGGTGTPSNLTVTGRKPTSWVLSASTTGGTNTLDMSSDSDGNLVVDFNSDSGGATHYIQLSQQINTAGNYSAADLVQAMAQVEFLTGSNVNSIYLRITDTAAGTIIYTGFEKSGTDNFPITTMGRGVIGSARFNPGATPVSITVAFRAEVNSSGQTAQAKFKLLNCGLFKIT